MIPWRVANPAYHTPWCTWSVMLLCVLVYALQVLTPAELQPLVFAQYGLVPRRMSALLAGAEDPWALLSVFTSMFMHGGVVHVASNLWFLRLFGDNVEERLGQVRYALFYLISGLGAALLQWAISPLSTVPMVGASGAIAGVLAAYLVFFPKTRVQTVIPLFVFVRFVELPSFLVILFWFGLQLVSALLSRGAHAGVAYWAHIGGFVSGLLLALALRRTEEPEQREGELFEAPKRR